MRPIGLFILAAAALVAFSPCFENSSADEIKSPRTAAAVSSGAGEFSSMQCASCHRMTEGFSHPVNVPLQRGMKSQLPLTNSRVTCISCHDAGIETHRLARASGGSLLRTQNAVSLCVQCHDSSDNSRFSQHALSLGKAHLISSTKSRQPLFGEALRRENQNCLTCHDGLISNDIAMTSSNADDAMSEHPVNVSYRNVYDGARVILLKPSSSLNPAIRLFDGKVGCGSCHSLYSKQEKLLSMSNYRSQLCLGCHNQ